MRSLRARMMIGVSLLAIAAVVAVGLAVRVGAARSVTRYDEVVRIAQFAAPPPDEAAIVVALDRSCCQPQSLGAAQRYLTERQLLVVLDAEGRTKASVVGRGSTLRVTQIQRHGADVALVAESGWAGNARLIHLQFQKTGTPIHLADGTEAALYVFPVPAGDPELPRRAFDVSMNRWLLAAIATIAGLALLATWLLTRRIVGPIVQVSEAARALGQGDLQRRVHVEGHDEISMLGASFNQLAAELERQRALRRSIVQDVMHELRTPLTALGCRLHAMLDGMERDVPAALAGADRDLEHLTRIVEDLQELAQAEAGELHFAMARVDVAAVIESALDLTELRADPRTRIEITQNPAVEADAVRLRQILVNVLSNARRFTPADGRITVGAEPRGQDVEIRVRNTGSTLAQDQLERVFDRFYRGDDSRQRATGGSGLGLAIVKNLVEAQSGRVWATSDEESVTFYITLPSAT